MAAHAPLAPPSNAKTDTDLADASSAQRSCVPESGYPGVRESVPRSSEPAIPAPGTKATRPDDEPQRPNRLTHAASFPKAVPISNRQPPIINPKRGKKGKETPGISLSPAPPTPPHRDKPTFPWPLFPSPLPPRHPPQPTHPHITQGRGCFK